MQHENRVRQTIALCALGLVGLGLLIHAELSAVDHGRTTAALAASDPAGMDLVPGAIVAAYEKSGGVRIYKIVDTLYFPPPMSDELVMNAYREKAGDFEGAAALWDQGGLSIELTKVRVQRHMFRGARNYRVLKIEQVTEADKTAKNPPFPREPTH